MDSRGHSIQLTTCPLLLDDMLEHAWEEPFLEHEDRAQVDAVVGAVAEHVEGRGWGE